MTNSPYENDRVIPPSGNEPVRLGVTSSNSSSFPKPRNSQENLANRYAEVDIKKKFNPYRFRNNVEPFMGGIPIIFMTTPQMNIFEDPSSSDYTNGQALVSMITGVGLESRVGQLYMNSTGRNTGYATDICKDLDKASSLFGYYLQTDPELVRNLTYGESLGGTSSPWIKFLTNLFKGTNLKDLSMRTTEEYESYLGWKQILPGPNTDSYSADNGLAITFDETKNLDVIKFHTLWMEYIEAVRYGNHSPSVQMRMRRTIDYTSSLYFFILDFDMTKLLYWCKYTGVYPTNVPYSVLTPGDIVTKGPVDVTINYAYQYKEELRPTVIYDFNSVAKFAHKVVGYGRGSYVHDNVDETLNRSKTQYGWGDIAAAEDGKFYGLDFTNPDNRAFTNVEIKLMNNARYDTHNQTGFASDTNSNRNSFHLVFNNSKDQGYDAYIDDSALGMFTQDLYGSSDTDELLESNNPLARLQSGAYAFGEAFADNGGISLNPFTNLQRVGASIFDVNQRKKEQEEINAAHDWTVAQDQAAKRAADLKANPLSPFTNPLLNSVMGDMNETNNSGY